MSKTPKQNFYKSHREWHEANNGTFPSGGEYQKALRKHFKKWEHPDVAQARKEEIAGLKEELQEAKGFSEFLALQLAEKIAEELLGANDEVITVPIFVHKDLQKLVSAKEDGRNLKYILDFWSGRLKADGVSKETQEWIEENVQDFFKILGGTGWTAEKSEVEEPKKVVLFYVALPAIGNWTPILDKKFNIEKLGSFEPKTLPEEFLFTKEELKKLPKEYKKYVKSGLYVVNEG